RVLLGVIVLAFATCGFLTHPPRPHSGGTGGSGGTADNGGGGSPGSGGQTDGGPGDVVVPDDGGTPGLEMSCGDPAHGDPWSPGYKIDATAQQAAATMVQSMSLTDKAGQMRGTSPGANNNFSDIFRTLDNTNKGVKGFLFRDGPKGVCLAAELPAGDN